MFLERGRLDQVQFQQVFSSILFLKKILVFDCRNSARDLSTPAWLCEELQLTEWTGTVMCVRAYCVWWCV